MSHTTSGPHPTPEGTGLHGWAHTKPSSNPALLALWAPSQPSADVGQRKQSSVDPETREGPWPSSGPGGLSRSLLDLREGVLPPREESWVGEAGAPLSSPVNLWDVLFWDARQEELEWMICSHVCRLQSSEKWSFFCPEHYQVNCTIFISVGSSHMKLWNSWSLCQGNCSFLIRSSITHEFNSKQCYQQI